MSGAQTSEPTQDVPNDVSDALRVARAMIDAGIPVFAAPPCPGSPCTHGGCISGHHLPAKWELTVPSPVWLERWQPGWALGAVGGHLADFLDEDPRNGGSASIEELKASGQMPRVFGVQATPSGGFHYVINPLHERKSAGFMSGLDYQGGRPDGKGRAFVWIAPTVKRSKVAPYEITPYRWIQEPDLDYLREFNDDDSGHRLRDRILARKERAERISGQEWEQALAARAFTEDEARKFCSIATDRLMKAPIGAIEELANAAACQLSHFVPEFWSEEFAYAVLLNSLGETAYDPNHPASTWTAEKFHDVLAGVSGRAPNDWKAIRKPESLAEIVPNVDAVDALIAEMLSPEQIALHEPPRPLIKGLLTFDSESWIIGEPGSKKSFVALDMAGHVATGQDWQGLKVTKASVIMIIAEGAGGSGSRVKAWEREYGTMGSDVRILPRPVQAASLSAWAVLVEACRRLRPGLVVIDTQARVTVGLEENSAKEMGVYVEAVRAVREATGACVLTVHHTGRRGGDARGSSAIDGAQTTELKVVCEEGTMRGELRTEKQKDLEMSPPLPLLFQRVALGLDENGDPITSLVLCADQYKIAEGTEPVPVDEPSIDQENVSEPQEWTYIYFDNPKQWLGRQILQTLADAAGDYGLTETTVKRVVREKWYGGQSGKKAGQLREENWTRAWSRAGQLITDEGAKVLVRPGGERWSLNSDIPG